MMPRFRKLSEAETSALTQPQPGIRAQIAREYDAYLEGFVIGDYGRVELAEGEQRQVVRQRLQAAAHRRNLGLRFRPGPGAALIFCVEEARPAAPPPAPRPSKPQADVAAATPRPPARPARRRQSAAERYHEMLPRWMRQGEQGSRRGGKRRER